MLDAGFRPSDAVTSYAEDPVAMGPEYELDAAAIVAPEGHGVSTATAPLPRGRNEHTDARSKLTMTTKLPSVISTPSATAIASR